MKKENIIYVASDDDLGFDGGSYFYSSKEELEEGFVSGDFDDNYMVYEIDISKLKKFHVRMKLDLI